MPTEEGRLVEIGVFLMELPPTPTPSLTTSPTRYNQDIVSNDLWRNRANSSSRYFNAIRVENPWSGSVRIEHTDLPKK